MSKNVDVSGDQLLAYLSYYNIKFVRKDFISKDDIYNLLCGDSDFYYKLRIPIKNSKETTDRNIIYYIPIYPFFE